VKLYTIGYGGRTSDQLLALLCARGIRTVVDVRLRPDRASMGIFSLSKDPQKGIQGLLAKAGIQYVSFIEMGNVYFGMEDWPRRYRRLVDRAGDLLTERLAEVPGPVCLMCAEKRAADCHRRILAEYLTNQGWEAEHLE
jgi:uncharacterized protein (DUF488 family)